MSEANQRKLCTKDKILFLTAQCINYISDGSASRHLCFYAAFSCRNFSFRQALLSVQISLAIVWNSIARFDNAKAKQHPCGSKMTSRHSVENKQKWLS